MNLLSKLFAGRTPVAKSSTYTLEDVHRPARIAPEVWVNYGVEVEDVTFEEFELPPSSNGTLTGNFQFQ